MNPLVSVIIPVYNGTAFIRGAIESVFNQTLQDFEIIVVDDGSTDGTKDILDSWIRQNRIRYIYQQNKGLAGARNTGIRLAKGKFLKFLDCDDWLYPEQLQLQVEHLKNKSDYVISATDYELEFESKRKKVCRLWLGNKSQLARFIHGNPCPIHIILVQRSLVERMGGFDEGLRSFEDTDLWLQALIQGCIFERVEYVGCCYRILNTSLSADGKNMFDHHCKFSEKLNRALLPSIDHLPDEVMQNLIMVNIELIHTCFIYKIDPLSCLPVTSRVSDSLYQTKTFGIGRLLVKTIGIKQFAWIKYWKNCLTDRNYYVRLRDAESYWRKEDSYV